MSNEVTFGFATGKTLTFSVYEIDGTARQTGGTMTETPASSGLYLGSPTTMLAGDLVVIKEGTKPVGWGEFLTMVRLSGVFNIYDET